MRTKSFGYSKEDFWLPNYRDLLPVLASKNVKGGIIELADISYDKDSREWATYFLESEDAEVYKRVKYFEMLDEAKKDFSKRLT